MAGEVDQWLVLRVLLLLESHVIVKMEPTVVFVYRSCFQTVDMSRSYDVI